jgi:CrcB protein
MNGTAVALVALGGALGSVARFVLTTLLSPISRQFPSSTILINVVGSFVIAYVAGRTTQHTNENVRLFVMVGLCGGFTTFSSFSLQTFELIQRGAAFGAIVNVVLSVTICLLAVAAGYALAR